MSSLSRILVVFLTLSLGTSALAQQRAPVTNQSRRPVVAVQQLRDLANTGQGEAFLTMIQTAIVSSNRFRVIERNFDVLNSEQNLANNGVVTTNTPGRRGGYEGVDFQISASITQAQARQTTNGTCGAVDTGFRVLFGRSVANCNRSQFSLSIDIRITEQAGGRIRHTATVREDVTSGSDNAPDYITAFRSAAQQISNELTLAIYPIQVATVQPDGVFILNYGADVLQEGNVLRVMGADGGCTAVDPANGECLTSEVQELGMIRVIETTPRFSRAVAVRPFAVAPPAGANARIVDNPPPESRNRNRNRNRGDN